MVSSAVTPNPRAEPHCTLKGTCCWRPSVPWSTAGLLEGAPEGPRPWVLVAGSLMWIGSGGALFLEEDIMRSMQNCRCFSGLNRQLMAAREAKLLERGSIFGRMQAMNNEHAA